MVALSADGARSKSKGSSPAGFHALQADLFSPDSGIQASVRRFDLETHRLSVDDKVVLTARQVHDPTKGKQNPPWIGYGWDATVSGLVDMGFSRIDDRLFTLLLAEQSNELVLMPSDAAPYKSKTDKDAPGLPELRLGHRPVGLAAHPTMALVYAYNSLSFDVSEVDISDPARPRERRRIAVAGAESWSPVASASANDGAKLFYSSANPRISVNEKVSCANCHVNGGYNGRTWAFQALPDGTSGQGHGMRGVQTLLVQHRIESAGRDLRPRPAGFLVWMGTTSSQWRSRRDSGFRAHVSEPIDGRHWLPRRCSASRTWP